MRKTSLNDLFRFKFYRPYLARVENSLKSLERKIQAYNQLHILTTIYNHSYGVSYIPYLTSMCGVIFVQGVIILIRLAYLNNFLITSCGALCILCCGMILLLITTLTSSVHENSSNFVNHINSTSAKGKLEKRLVYSLKVVSVKSGQFYEIRKNTCLTALGMLVNVSGSMLMSINF